MNRVILSGRWTKDIDFKTFDSGKNVAKSTLAVDDGYGDKKKTYFIFVEAWGKLGESVANHSGKGRKVLVDGRMVVDTWGEGEDRKSITKIVADSIEFLDYKDREGESSQPSDNNLPPEPSETPIDISDDDLPF
jgi:single-strand DNA-binding protein